MRIEDLIHERLNIIGKEFIDYTANCSFQRIFMTLAEKINNIQIIRGSAKDVMVKITQEAGLKRFTRYWYNEKIAIVTIPMTGEAIIFVEDVTPENIAYIHSLLPLNRQFNITYDLDLVIQKII